MRKFFIVATCMDWEIKTLARTSFVSQRPFQTGERVTCVIFRSPEGLARADLRADEAAAWQPPGEVLGRWERAVKDAAEDERERRRQALESAEETFLALMDDPGGAGADKELLLQLLALMLERKRILKALGRPVAGVQRYHHPKLEREFSVAQRELGPENLAALHAQMEQLAF